MEDREALPNHSSAPLPLRDLPWTQRNLYRGVSIFREGDRADLVFLLESGLVKLSRQADSHRKTIVRLVRPGELIGDRTLSHVGYQRYTAEALADSVVLEVTREQFRLACAASTATLAWVTEQVEERLAEVERRIELISFARVELRLLALLADLAEATMAASDLPPDNVQIPLSQAEIAQLIGATRETASTTLNLLARRGLLRLSRRQVEVVSLRAVRDASLVTNRAVAAHA